ncbi:hypothetical protein BVI1335_2160004 [Burkholderia vietnamiensis]|nr:hypothetical protein BVI1335_2160004 [Burkholderia vietnamiensis]
MVERVADALAARVRAHAAGRL